MSNQYYNPEHHGPLTSVPLDGRYCVLQGGYVLCPAMLALDGEVNGGVTCGIFEVDLKTNKYSIFGIMGQRAPIQAPLRCEDCLASDVGIGLSVVVEEPEVEDAEDPE